MVSERFSSTEASRSRKLEARRRCKCRSVPSSCALLDFFLSIVSGVIVERRRARFLDGTGRSGVSKLSEHVVALFLLIVSDIELK